MLTSLELWNKGTSVCCSKSLYLDIPASNGKGYCLVSKGQSWKYNSNLQYKELQTSFCRKPYTVEDLNRYAIEQNILITKEQTRPVSVGFWTWYWLNCTSKYIVFYHTFCVILSFARRLSLANCTAVSNWDPGPPNGYAIIRASRQNSYNNFRNSALPRFCLNGDVLYEAASIT